MMWNAKLIFWNTLMCLSRGHLHSNRDLNLRPRKSNMNCGISAGSVASLRGSPLRAHLFYSSHFPGPAPALLLFATLPRMWMIQMSCFCSQRLEASRKNLCRTEMREGALCLRKDKLPPLKWKLGQFSWWESHHHNRLRAVILSDYPALSGRWESSPD